MYTIAVVNQKGGAGKTTTSIQLVAGLASKGHKIIACDMDAQANLKQSRRSSPRPCTSC